MCNVTYVDIVILWNCRVHGEFPGKFESSNLSREILSREIGHSASVASMLRCQCNSHLLRTSSISWGVHGVVRPRSYMYMYRYMCIHVYRYIHAYSIHVYAHVDIFMYIYIYIYASASPPPPAPSESLPMMSLRR